LGQKCGDEGCASLVPAPPTAYLPLNSFRRRQTAVRVSRSVWRSPSG